jgi:hypothetical protein
MQVCWRLQETIATLESSVLSGEVDVLFPWHGFLWNCAAAQAKVALLKVFTRASAGPTPETLVDCYQRGIDLVATYAQTPERTVRPQVYWRYLAPQSLRPEATGLELILSTQTSLLDSEPTTSLESALPAGEVIGMAATGQLQSLASDQWQTGDDAPRAVLFRSEQLKDVSYLECVHSTDFAGVQISHADGLSIVRWRLFPERLEKGVIRRGRVRGYLLPRASDEALALELIKDFASSQLVLST